MSKVTTNPCLSCGTNQHCCSRLSGLLLSEDEFARHFARHRDGLVVGRSGKVVTVSANTGGPCPHWGKDGCRIYGERPIDCRVFPYTPSRIIDRGVSVKIVFHDRSDCPNKERLFLELFEAEVKALLLAFGRQLYGEARIIIVQREKGMLSRICNRIEAALYRRLSRLRPR